MHTPTDFARPKFDPSQPNFLNIPVGPRPVQVPVELIRRRRERAMDIEYAFFERRFPIPVWIWELGDALIAIHPKTRKKLGHRIVRVDP